MRYTISIVMLLLCGCMTLDGNLFNSREQDSYELPGNTIPLSAIHADSLDSEGNTLFAYWVQGDSSADTGLTLLYCHGNKHSIDHYWDRVMLFNRLGCNVFIFDYRGYGRSEGTLSEKGLYTDARAAWNHVRSVYGVPADSMVLYGYSLGNAASIHLAARYEALCLFSEAPFASANSLTQGSTIIDIPPLWLTEGDFDNATTVKEINCPLFMFHGQADDFVRYRDNGKVVYENAPDPKNGCFPEDANHDDLPQVIGEEAYLDYIRNWIGKSQVDTL